MQISRIVTCKMPLLIFKTNVGANGLFSIISGFLTFKCTSKASFLDLMFVQMRSDAISLPVYACNCWAFWSQDNCFKCTFLVPDSGSMHWLTSCYQQGSEIVLIWEHLFQAVWLIFVQALPSCCTPIWVWSYIFWCTWHVIFPVSVCFAWDWNPVKKGGWDPLTVMCTCVSVSCMFKSILSRSAGQIWDILP